MSRFPRNYLFIQHGRFRRKTCLLCIMTTLGLRYSLWRRRRFFVTIITSRPISLIRKFSHALSGNFAVLNKYPHVQAIFFLCRYATPLTDPAESLVDSGPNIWEMNRWMCDKSYILKEILPLVLDNRTNTDELFTLLDCVYNLCPHSFSDDSPFYSDLRQRHYPFVS